LDNGRPPAIGTAVLLAGTFAQRRRAQTSEFESAAVGFSAVSAPTRTAPPKKKKSTASKKKKKKPPRRRACSVSPASSSAPRRGDATVPCEMPSAARGTPTGDVGGDLAGTPSLKPSTSTAV